jgi:phage replication O-like protein O
MDKKDLQVENGNFTRIINPLLDALIKIPFRGCEVQIAMFVIRKTYGYGKKQDSISLSQFSLALGRSRQTIVDGLKNLQLVKIVRLVKKGDSIMSSNIYEINKYIESWELVKMSRLVKRNRGTSLELTQKLVKIARHTKDNTKDNTKEKGKNEFLQGNQINELIELFKEVNPMYKDFFKNTTERRCIDEMAKQLTYEKLKATIEYLPKIIGQPFAPKPTKPTELRRDLGKLIAFNNQKKSELTINKKERKIA